MNIGFFERMKIIFDYMFSSFLSIETLVLSILMLSILLINIKVKNKYVNFIAVGIYIGFILGIAISYRDYVGLCISGFVKEILYYIYFPSTFIYFLNFTVITFLMLGTVFSKKLSNFKKIINYIFFSMLYFLFMSFIILAIYSGVDIYNIADLYKNNIILCIVQCSNLLFGIWIIFTMFYNLYFYFKKKYD